MKKQSKNLVVWLAIIGIIILSASLIFFRSTQTAFTSTNNNIVQYTNFPGTTGGCSDSYWTTLNSKMIRSNDATINTGVNTYKFSLAETTSTDATKPNNIFCTGTVKVYKDDVLVDTFTAYDSAAGTVQGHPFAIGLNVPHTYSDNLNNTVIITPIEVYGNFGTGIYQCTNSWKLNYDIKYSEKVVNFNITPSKSSFSEENATFTATLKNNLNIPLSIILTMHYSQPVSLGVLKKDEIKNINIDALQSQTFDINLPALKSGESYIINYDIVASGTNLFTGLNAGTTLAHVQARLCDSDYNSDLPSIWGIDSTRVISLFNIKGDDYTISFATPTNPSSPITGNVIVTPGNETPVIVITPGNQTNTEPVSLPSTTNTAQNQFSLFQNKMYIIYIIIGLIVIGIIFFYFKNKKKRK